MFKENPASAGAGSDDGFIRAMIVRSSRWFLNICAHRAEHIRTVVMVRSLHCLIKLPQQAKGGVHE